MTTYVQLCLVMLCVWETVMLYVYGYLCVYIDVCACVGVGECMVGACAKSFRCACSDVLCGVVVFSPTSSKFPCARCFIRCATWLNKFCILYSECCIN